MSAIWRVARREWRDWARDRGMVGLTAATLLLLAAATLAAVPAHRLSEQRKAESAATVRAQWLEQGARHPHSAAHFGIVAFRQLPGTALLEPGVSVVVGQAVPLVTHQRAFALDPAAADRSSAVRYAPSSPAWLALTLLPFVVIVAGHRAITGERESGNLGLLLGTGVAPSTLVAGKLLALGALGVGLLLAKAAIDAIAVAAVAADPPWGRLAGLELVHAVYLLVWVALTLAISARVRSSPAALAVLLGLWTANTVVVPRVAASVGRIVVQEPSLSEFKAAIQHDITYLPDGRPWAESWSRQLIDATLERYGVSRIEDLPVGYAGIMLKSSDAHYEEVFDRHFAALDRLHARQAAWHHLVSVTGPLVSAAALGQAFAGSDLVHTRQFADEAEAYRRVIVHRTNDAIEHESTGTGWDLKVGDAFWASLPAFAPRPPAWSDLWAGHRLSVAVLLAWLVGGAVWCARGAAAVRP